MQIFKTIKRGKKIKSKQPTFLPCFDWCVQIFGLEACNNASLHPFMFLFLTFKPCNAFLQIYLGIFNGNIFQALETFF
jgi:hypothetical protein